MGGILEILVILVVAVIALGPNKLPQAIIDVVKFFRAVKKTMADAKETFDKELQLAELKQEVLKYKNAIDEGVKNVTKDIELDKLREIQNDTKSTAQEATKDISNSLAKTLDSLNSELGYTTKESTSLESSTESSIISNAPLQDSKNLQDLQATQDSNNLQSLNATQTSQDSTQQAN